MNLETVAELCYESVRIYNQSFGNYNAPKWCELDDNSRENNKRGLLQIVCRESITPDFDKAIPEEYQIPRVLEVAIANALKPFIQEELVNV